ncbi:MAG: gliding motility-associated C-terminal domain-containing protein [Crocinitomicaceae bacterium]
MYKKFASLVSFVVLSFVANAQNNFTINPAINSPVNGCYLSSTETVWVYLVNTNNYPFSGNVQMGYSLNWGPPVTQTVNINGLGAYGSFSYQFPNLADLSACQEHNLKIWVWNSLDPVHTNDTINVTIISDCAPVVGEVTGPDTVCFGNNQDTLDLINYVGNVHSWETSTDGGVSWGSILTGNDFLGFSNITNAVDVQVIVESQWGYCPNDTTDEHHIALDQLSYAGILPADFDICDNGNAGVIETNGFTSQIVDWMYSFDGGTTWQNQGHPYDTISYANFTGDVQVMVSAVNGVCPVDTSNILNLTYIQGTQAGTLSGTTLACNWDNNGQIISSGNYGDVVLWWYSVDSGATWNQSLQGIGDSIYSFANLTASTWFAAEIQYANCPTVFTAPHAITIKPVNIQASADTTITEGDEIQLFASANGATGFYWWPDDFMDDPTSATPTVAPEFDLTYFVQITDLDGCADTARVNIKVEPDLSLLQIPNLFTPNGDGYNDNWEIRNLDGFPDNEVTVFNIYGQIVFGPINYNNDWGGDYNGKQLPDGTYFYILDLKIPETDPLYLPPFQGVVTIAGND